MSGRAGVLDPLVEGLRQRRHRALGRAVSLVEDGGAEARELLARLRPDTGGARLVGITGPPGAGKSTLVERLARVLREGGETLGILAVDPTSPYSGGALLGDRIRMQSLYTDPGVFIRSMATRGALGGLAAATHDAVDILDAAGFDWVLVETVGVGQDEVEVVRCVDTVVVVTVPGLGDGIQAIKAGLMEIADVFVINKADREGVERAARDLQVMLEMGEVEGWRPPIIRTVASRGEGVGELVAALGEHRRWLTAGGELERRRLARFRQRVETILQRRVLAGAERAVGLERALARAQAERLDPYRVAEELFEEVVEAEQRPGR